MRLKRNMILFLLSITMMLGTVPSVSAATQTAKNPNPFAFENITDDVNATETRYFPEKLCASRDVYQEGGSYNGYQSPFENAIDALPKLKEVQQPSTSDLIMRLTLSASAPKTNWPIKYKYELRKDSLRFEKKETRSFTNNKTETVVLAKAEYKLSESQYSKLQKALEETKKRDTVYAEWLYTTSFDFFDDIVCRDGTKIWQESEIDMYSLMALTRGMIQHIEVVPDSLKAYETGITGKYPKAVEVQIVIGDGFPNFIIAIDGDKLYIERSDKNYVCGYTLVNAADVVARMREIFNTPPNIQPDDEWGSNMATGKPVIYLYPEKEQKVSVKLNFEGDLSYTYPAYNNGWNVTAYPNGRIVNNSDKSEHSYLFWEGTTLHKWNFDSGFLVKGEDTERFLKEKLSYMGLIHQEYNDFITYWVPQMHGNKYNLISFSALEEYARVAKLEISPKPDSLLRIHMAWQALDAPVTIPQQQLKTFVRKGFTVVEWGGTETKEKLK